MARSFDPFEMYCFASLYQDGSVAIDKQWCATATVTDESGNVRQNLHASGLLIPSSILMALSLEVLLKCVLVIRGVKFDRKHSLEKLFNDIPDGDRCRIKALFTDLGNEADFHREMAIDSVLERLNEYFVDMRYGFEIAPCDRLPVGDHYRQGEDEGIRGIFGLSRAVKAVQAFILEVHPNWEIRFQQREHFFH